MAGAFMMGDMHGRGHVWQVGVCVWWGGMCGGGHVWCGACVAGACMMGGMHGRGMYPTGVLSCLKCDCWARSY